MGRCRVVKPEVIRLPLSSGDFIDVKSQLTAGETRMVYAGMVKEQRFGEQATADPTRVGLTKIMQYLLAWSLVDLEGKPLPLTESDLLGQDMPTFLEINEAIDAHVLKMEQEATDRKKTTSGEAGLKAT